MIFKYDNLRIMGGSHSWELQKPRTRKDKKTGETKTEWESFQWHGSLQSVITALVEHRVRTVEVETLAEALEEVKKLSTALSQALTPKYEISVAGGIND